MRRRCRWRWWVLNRPKPYTCFHSYWWALHNFSHTPNRLPNRQCRLWSLEYKPMYLKRSGCLMTNLRSFLLNSPISMQMTNSNWDRLRDKFAASEIETPAPGPHSKWNQNQNQQPIDQQKMIFLVVFFLLFSSSLFSLSPCHSYFSWLIVVRFVLMQKTIQDLSIFYAMIFTKSKFRSSRLAILSLVLSHHTIAAHQFELKSRIDL